MQFRLGFNITVRIDRDKHTPNMESWVRAQAEARKKQVFSTHSYLFFNTHAETGSFLVLAGDPHGHARDDEFSR